MKPNTEYKKSPDKQENLCMYLVYIDVSVDRWAIDRNLAYGDLIESTIVHILDDEIPILDP